MPYLCLSLCSSASTYVATWGHQLTIRSTGEEACAARADVRYARQFADSLPPNSIVLTHNPSMFHIWGTNAAQLSIARTDPGRIEQLLKRYAGGVYLHWNFWCNVPDRV